MRVREKNQKFLIAAAATFLVVAIVFAPASSWYKQMVRDIWNADYPGLAYYLNFDDADFAMQTGNYYFGTGAYDLPKATHSYQLALRLSPGVLWGHYQLARIYYVEGDFTKATQEINAELQANPQNKRSLYVRGLIEISQNNLAAAESDFSQFVQWAPMEWGGYNDLAFVLADEGKYAQSEATIKQAMQQVPGAGDIPWLWNSLGLAQLNELHYTQAQSSFTEALALAEKITPQEWHRAYSGNDPAATAQSITAFQDAIKKNISIAQRGNLL